MSSPHPKLRNPVIRRTKLMRSDSSDTWSPSKRMLRSTGREIWSPTNKDKERLAQSALETREPIISNESDSKQKNEPVEESNEKTNECETFKGFSFNIYDKKVSPALQEAFDSIFGFPFRGSLAFIGLYEIGNQRKIDKILQTETVWRKRFQGQASLRKILTRQETSYVKGLQIDVISGGYDDGNTAVISIDGKDQSKNLRGFNFVAIKFPTGQKYSESIDTHFFNEAEEGKMENFCKRLFETKCTLLLAVAVKEDASKNLKTCCRQELEKFGLVIPNGDDAITIKELINQKSLSGSHAPSLLNLSAKSNAYKVCDLLIVEDWRIDYRPKHGLQNTALHDAIYHGSMETARVLIGRGASTRIRNKKGETAEDMLLRIAGLTVSEFLNQYPYPLPKDPTSEVVFSVLKGLDLE